jgi:hypothetical protein
VVEQAAAVLGEAGVVEGVIAHVQTQEPVGRQ